MVGTIHGYVTGAMTVDSQLKDLLTKLHKCGARVTGSLARGQFREGWSDVDLYIPYGKWPKAMEAMRVVSVKWESSWIGHFASRELSTMLECSYLFDRQPKYNLLDTVELAGMIWKTW